MFKLAPLADTYINMVHVYDYVLCLLISCSRLINCTGTSLFCCVHFHHMTGTTHDGKSKENIDEKKVVKTTAQKEAVSTKKRQQKSKGIPCV